MLPAAAGAVPPPPGSVPPDRPSCRLNLPALHSRASRARAVAAAPFFPVPLAPTTAYVAVIRADFSDKPMTKTRAETEAFFAQVKNFYIENSYGVLAVSATVTERQASGTAGAQGAYRLPSTLASYAQGLCSDYSGLAHAALTAVGSDLNFSNGAPGGNAFHHVMVYHAGQGAETSADPGCQTDNIWSVFAPTAADSSDGILEPLTKNGVFYDGATIVPETEAQGISPLGVICHEYGHQLGLPDLYKNPSTAVIGEWSLMDSGVYVGSPLGSNPAHLDAWSKQFLGFFSNPRIVTVGETAAAVSLGLALSSSGAYLRFPIQGVAGIDGSKEYFLVERRARSSLTGKEFDDALPFDSTGEGTLIWHVDDSIALDGARLAENSVNSGSPHFGVDLVEAGGSGAIARTDGKSSDPFPGSSGNTLFASPHSNAFDGRQSGILLSGFSGTALVAKQAFARDALSISRAANFPNPGGPAYPQKAGAPAGTLTTILLNAAKPPEELELTIHDVSGALVRHAQRWEIRANGSASADGKFVYEFDWDGRSDSREPAASGLYFYRFKADGTAVRTGKLVIIR